MAITPGSLTKRHVDLYYTYSKSDHIASVHTGSCDGLLMKTGCTPSRKQHRRGFKRLRTQAVRQLVRAIRAEKGWPWDDILGTVSADLPTATNANVRKLMRRRRGR